MLVVAKVYYVLETPQIGVFNEEQKRQRKHDDMLCRGNILNTLNNCLYDLYSLMTSANTIWNTLEEKYTVEKEGEDNKLINFKFFEFNMKDNTFIMDQVHEFLILVSKFKNLTAIITKLPPSWRNY